MIIVYIAIIVIVPILSQCIRFAIEANVKPQGTVSVIPGLFNLTYSENRGVAFGLFQDGTVCDHHLDRDCCIRYTSF